MIYTDSIVIMIMAKTNHDQTGVKNLSKKGHLAHGVVEAANFELAHLEYN